MKYRYTYQHDETARLMSHVITLEELEAGLYLKDKELVEAMGYSLVARDRYTMTNDIDGKEIYEGDITYSTIDDTEVSMAPMYHRLHEVKLLMENDHEYFCHLHNQFELVNHDHEGEDSEHYNLFGKHCYDCKVQPDLIRSRGIKVVGNVYGTPEFLSKDFDYEKYLEMNRPS